MNGHDPLRLPRWEPARFAVRFESATPSQARGTRIALHAATPFVAQIAPGTDLTDTLFERIGHAYLQQLDAYLTRTGRAGLGLPDGWNKALDPARPGGTEAPLRWLPAWPPFGEPDGDDPLASPGLSSWRLERRADGAGETVLVLVAAETVTVEGLPRVFDRRIGLRIPMGIGGDVTHGHAVAVTSMSAELPFRPYLSLTEMLERRPASELLPQGAGEGLEGLAEDLVATFEKARDDVDRQLSQSLGLQPGLTFDGFRVRWADDENGEPVAAAMQMLGRGLDQFRNDADGRRLTKGFRADYHLGPHDPMTGGRTWPLTTNAAPPGRARVFREDPPAARPAPAPGTGYDWSRRRPRRDEKTLDAFRREARIGLQQDVPLHAPGYSVRNCPGYVEGDPAGGTKTVSLPPGQFPPIRANEFSAISAFVQAGRFFDAIASFGIPLATFYVETLPGLRVFYRSGIVPGPGKDGRTINARVALEEEAPTVLGAPSARIAMHLALGDLARWSRRRGQGYAEPLGIAGSLAWMWHEVGHVLVAARLGDLEFDFAHSPGDAMAAVMIDPHSVLANVDRPWARYRGTTFPWIFATRRHDRAIALGWTWSGGLNRPLLEAPEHLKAGRKGYITEQILSTTLFRLYLVLGGETVHADGKPDRAVRERAALVTLFLLVQAVRSMAQPPSIAEMLEAAMEDADATLAAPLPLLLASGAGATGWVGGRALKVVRWAFEAQGMFREPTAPETSPGAPPPVDIYVPDRRPRHAEADGERQAYGPGSYVPVSLDWDGERLWFASSQGLSVDPPRLMLGNRGAQAAGGVSWRGWVGLLQGVPSDPGWDGADRVLWLSDAGPFALPGTIPPGGRRRVPLPIDLDLDLSAQPQGRLLLLVEVSCADDPANCAATTGLATAIPAGGFPPTVPRELADLVANDNNLALRFV